MVRMFQSFGVVLFLAVSQICYAELEPVKSCAQLLTTENAATPAGDKMLAAACDFLQVAAILRGTVDNFDDAARVFLAEQGVSTAELPNYSASEMEKRKHEYLRFGKRKHEYLRFGKRKHEYLRFG